MALIRISDSANLNSLQTTCTQSFIKCGINMKIRNGREGGDRGRHMTISFLNFQSRTYPISSPLQTTNQPSFIKFGTDITILIFLQEIRLPEGNEGGGRGENFLKANL